MPEVRIMTVVAWWTFQEFGVSRVILVRVVGADQRNSLIGRDIAGTLPGGKLFTGVCISLVGESAALLCDPRIRNPDYPTNRSASIQATSFLEIAYLGGHRQTLNNA